MTRVLFQRPGMQFQSPIVKIAMAALKRTLRQIGFAQARRDSPRTIGEAPNRPPPVRALEWLVGNEIPTGGIRVHSGRHDAYPEVSGYLIPTLIRYGETGLARRLVSWLLRTQAPDGSFSSPEGIPCVFDTGQALRGLLAGSGLVPESRPGARRAADYVVDHMIDGGRGGFRKQYWYSMPEGVGIHIVGPLFRAADVLGEPKYRAAATMCLGFFSRPERERPTDILTHFLGYELEALIDLGASHIALPLLAKIKDLQNPDGSVAGRYGVSWVCTPGLAQLAVCWYKVGDWAPADRALAWLEAHQGRTGGFLGSYGPNATYFPDVEVPWATKFYLDAHQLRVQSFFRRERIAIPGTINPADGRARSILSAVQPGQRVLDVGCGKGRYLRVVAASRLDGIRLVGLDLDPSLLSHAPRLAGRTAGCMEILPYRDSCFDVVFAVEAIEHSSNFRAAIGEMIRVCRVGGGVVIIDKEHSQWGRLDCPPWERWPRTAEVVNALGDRCEDVKFEAIGYDHVTNPDGLMVLWRGRKKRAP